MICHEFEATFTVVQYGIILHAYIWLLPVVNVMTFTYIWNIELMTSIFEIFYSLLITIMIIKINPILQNTAYNLMIMVNSRTDDFFNYSVNL